MIVKECGTVLNRSFTLSHQQIKELFKIIKNDNAITDSHMIANAFNDYFANIGKDLANSIPTVQKSPFEYLKDPPCDSFCIFSQ